VTNSLGNAVLNCRPTYSVSAALC